MNDTGSVGSSGGIGPLRLLIALSLLAAAVWAGLSGISRHRQEQADLDAERRSVLPVVNSLLDLYDRNLPLLANPDWTAATEPPAIAEQARVATAADIHIVHGGPDDGFLPVPASDCVETIDARYRQAVWVYSFAIDDWDLLPLSSDVVAMGARPETPAEFRARVAPTRVQLDSAVANLRRVRHDLQSAC